MDTQTVTIEIEDRPNPAYAPVTMAVVRSAVERAIDHSPHSVLDWDRVDEHHIDYLIASDDMANATTLIHDAISLIDGAKVTPDQIIHA